MIKVPRSPRSAPSVLKGVLAVAERQDAAKHYARGRHEFDRFPFRAYRHPDVRERLLDLFHQKCAYCESRIGPENLFDVEHHRPKLGALNLDGKVAPDHYWWLASEWTNLFPITSLICADYCARRTTPTVTRIPSSATIS